MARVGIISGREAFTSALIDALNERPGIEAEWCQIPPARLGVECPYRVIIDRLSHCFEYYQPYLKQAALSGTYVINNPFWFLADDKYFNYALAVRMGVAIPRTVLLPSKEYDERVLNPDDLHNLEHPLDWESILDYVGLPAILKPYDGYGWREVHKIETAAQLMQVYNESQMDVMMLQEFIDYEHYVRCFVIGGQWVLPIRYDPEARRYIPDHQHLSDELGLRIVHDCQNLCRTLGYDINTVEFAIRDGVPYAIDFMNPVPDAKPEVITPHYFGWVVDRVCDLVEDRIERGAKTPFRLACDMPELPPAPAPDAPVTVERRRFAVLG